MSKDVMIPYRIFKFLLGGIYKWYYRPTFIGVENIPKEGPLIFVGNHKHIMDQNGPILCNKRPIHYMAKKEYFDDKKVAWFFKMSGCIAVDRSKKDPIAKEKALKVLENGNCLGLFPEGTRNKTEAFLLPFKYGAVSLAHKTNATLVPFAVTGDYVFHGDNLTYRFGKPFKAQDDLEKTNKYLYRQICNLMRTSLKEEEKRKKAKKKQK